MKIPKHIQNTIERRRRLACELEDADVELSEWMEKQGMDLNEFTDFTNGGCMVYCEPFAAAESVTEAIENYAPDNAKK